MEYYKMEDKNWKDVTSYSQRDKEKIPRTLELRKLSPFNTRLVISRHIHYPDTWLVSCKGTDIDNVDLHTDNVEEAKQKAIDCIMNYASRMLDKWNEIIDILNN
jgi:hypothetical protein